MQEENLEQESQVKIDTQPSTEPSAASPLGKVMTRNRPASLSFRPSARMLPPETSTEKRSTHPGVVGSEEQDDEIDNLLEMVESEVSSSSFESSHQTPHPQTPCDITPSESLNSSPPPSPSNVNPNSQQTSHLNVSPQAISPSVVRAHRHIQKPEEVMARKIHQARTQSSTSLLENQIDSGSDSRNPLSRSSPSSNNQKPVSSPVSSPNGFTSPNTLKLGLAGPGPAKITNLNGYTNPTPPKHPQPQTTTYIPNMNTPTSYTPLNQQVQAVSIQPQSPQIQHVSLQPSPPTVQTVSIQPQPPAQRQGPPSGSPANSHRETNVDPFLVQQMRNNLFVLVKGLRSIEEARTPKNDANDEAEALLEAKQRLMLQAIQKMNNMNQINGLFKNHPNRQVQQLEGSSTHILQLAARFIRLHQQKTEAPQGDTTQLLQSIVAAAKDVATICSKLG